MSILKTFLMAAVCLFALPAIAESPSWRSTNIQFLHGNQYELGPKTRESITIEHASTWSMGQSYFFSNIFNRRDVGTEFYAEFYPRMTWKAITGKPSPVKLLDDFSVVAGINIGNLPRNDPFKAYLLGLGVKFKAPAMENLSLDVMAFKSENANTTGIQVSPVWSMKFNLGKHRFWCKGFIEWQSAKATGNKPSLSAQPQLLLDIGHYWQHDHQIYAGIEYAYARNKFGTDGVIEQVPQAMLLIPF
ncbi:Nucleoside-binding outer membrane protein [Methylophaga thiooxydans]|uniref:Nucleoside-binding outer membrane protein n=1 Tax=Methylophaga thiooxydans TaxID=392484 RepID=A0A0A0BI45_9GAMM|nr:outer membrane protein OmpK [Methylophaga thiooxydans]KGM06739.1 Nucleoside-binding outer membrane protein [Methylophaga thiooxydans]